MNFDWDHSKNEINIRKHDIDFFEAAKVFKDPHYIVNEDNRHNYDETRYQIIGAVAPHGVLFVVYTERQKDTVRIISARQATKKECRLYQQNI